jgi:hypothetical protein
MKTIVRRWWLAIQRTVLVTWHDPAGVYSEHGREGL